MGVQVTEGLGAGSQPDVGRAAAEEVIDEIRDHLSRRAHGVRHRRHGRRHRHRRRAGHRPGRQGAGHPDRRRRHQAVPLRRRAPHEVSPKPGIAELQKCVDTLIIIPNQNLFRVANEKTTFADAFAMADQVLYSGVACITDLMVKEGLINLDFADVRAIMREMGKAMMGTGEASGEKRALRSAEAAIANPLIDDVSMKGAQRSSDLDHRRQGPHAVRGRRGRDPHPRGGRPGRQHHRRRDLRRGLEGIIRVSVVATGIDHTVAASTAATRVTRSLRRQRVETPRAAPPSSTLVRPISLAGVAHIGGACSRRRCRCRVEFERRSDGPAITPKPSLFVSR